MQRFIARRLFAFIPTLFGISIIIFTVMHLIPGDTIDAMIGTQFRLTDAQAQALREYYGLDKSLPEQYGRWLLAALQGDFGYSVRKGEPVLPLILRHYPLTLELALFAMVIAVALGIPLGVLSAVRRDSVLDVVGRVLALIGLAVPNFWLATLIILILSLHFQIMPNAGNYVGFFGRPHRKPEADDPSCDRPGLCRQR